MPGRQRSPRRVLIVSATIGEGHNAAGRALADAVRRLWPGCEIRWLDTLQVMGPGIGPLGRACYVMQVEQTPWMYEFFFRMIWRHRWFLDSTRRMMGSWCGRRMHRVIRSYHPDLILSTYPLGSAGLSWLRAHRGLDTPAAAWVSDFCPHPYWVYARLDRTYVMHEAAVAVAERAEPGARIAVGALPVSAQFGAGDRDKARAALGLDQDAFIAVLSAGSLGFGNAGHAVTAILAASPDVQAVAICGRNSGLVRRLAALGLPPERLRVVSWTDEMPSWITASDVVVTNAGGVTALEALRSARPVIMFQPIAAHGRANAELMALAGLAERCDTPGQLTAAIAALASGPRARAAADDAAAEAAAAGRRLEDDLREFWETAHWPRRELLPVRAEDALFLDAQTPQVTQQVGAAVMLDGPINLPSLRAAVTSRVARIPELRRCLVPPRARWARPRWEVAGSIDAAARISEVTLGAGRAPPTLAGLVSQFFSTPLDPARTPWQMLLVHRAHDTGSDGQSAVIVKLHHALGDSYALISALSGLFDAAAEAARSAGPGQPQPRPRHRMVVATALARAARTAGWVSRMIGGLYGMAREGRAAPSPFNGPVTTTGRAFVPVKLPARAVTVTARRLGVSPADLVLALVADALAKLLGARGEETGSVRVLVPRTARPAALAPPLRSAETAPGDSAVPLEAGRGPASGRRRSGYFARLARLAEQGYRSWARRRGIPRPAAGNRTAGVLLDLPVGPMPAAQRAREIRRRHTALLRRGDAEAAAFVLHAMNLLPEPLRRAFARRVYCSRRFNLIVSVFPGVRRRCFVLGAEITEVYPVLALASGVRLAVGAMTWGQSLSFGVLADEGLAADASALADGIQQAFLCCAEAAGQ
jgi:diacylglycerol O-acyltransferase